MAVEDVFDTVNKAAVKAPAGDDILRECLSVAELLIDKNTRYGNSALEPVRIFSKAGTVEQIRVRIDDKLSRLVRGESIDDAGREDAERDLLGYLVLLRIAQRREQPSRDTS